MENYLIDFKNIDWDNPALGVRYKSYIKGNQRIRLVEFSADFVEEDWCTKGHRGYVIQGSISIDFDGATIKFEAGDGLFITEGEGNKHKAKVAKGEKVLIILFEEV